MTVTASLDAISADVARSLSIFFTELERARRDGDEHMVREASRAIAEAMRGAPAGPIDEPLLPLRRKRATKRHR